MDTYPMPQRRREPLTPWLRTSPPTHCATEPPVCATYLMPRLIAGVTSHGRALSEVTCSGLRFSAAIYW